MHRSFQPAFSLYLIVAIFSLRTQLSTLVISFILVFQMMKTLFVCGKISLVKLIACYIHSFAVALSVLRPSFSLAFACLFMDPVYGPLLPLL